MCDQTAQALRDFTHRYCDLWQQEYGHVPVSDVLNDIHSPCYISSSNTHAVYWRPQPFTATTDFSGVERAFDIRLQPSIPAWYSTQFAGDMCAEFAGKRFTLLQTWSEDDFIRLQQNVIGHLLMKRQLGHPPTVFIAALPSEQDIISICNLTGEVILEVLGTSKKQVLAVSAATFLQESKPVRTM